MDDFYVYYVIDEENPSIGKIHAIAPHEVKEMADMSFIRIPADYGLQFTVGRKSISNWIVQYDDDSEDMVFSEVTTTVGIPFVSVFFQIPHIEKNPEMIITFQKRSKCFHVAVPSKGLRRPKRKLHFFVTPVDDPNMLYFQFPVDFSIASKSDGYVVSCPVTLPERFSVFTNKVLNRYQFRIVQ